MRQVNLIQYIPAFMQPYRQMTDALAAENEEFKLLWVAADKVFRNRFILTADESGIEHFEQLLGIIPGMDDSLETRRLRIQSRWFNKLPYTIRILAQRLVQALKGAYNFELDIKDFNEAYTLKLTVFTTDDSEDENLKYILSGLVPMNIVIDIVYEGVIKGYVYHRTVLQSADIITIKQRRM